jgi:peptidoglycan-associated lipoprotein
VTYRADAGGQGGAGAVDASGAGGQGETIGSGQGGAGRSAGGTAVAAIPGIGGGGQSGAADATAAQGAGLAGAGGVGQGGGAGSDPAGQMLAAATRFEPNEFVAVPELRDIYFELDRYDVRPEDARLLDANAEWLKANRSHLLLIEGHCDERGTNEHNLALGEHRAKSAMNYLISQGVEASRITIISYGEERPACSGKDEACWAQNRRAHFLVKAR